MNNLIPQVRIRESDWLKPFTWPLDILPCPTAMHAMSHVDDVKVCCSSTEIFEREKVIIYTSNDGKIDFILCLLAQLRQTIPAALEVLWHLWVFNSGSYLNVESRNTLYFEYDRAQHVVGCGPVAQWIARRPVVPAIRVQFPACHIFFSFFHSWFMVLKY